MSQNNDSSSAAVNVMKILTLCVCIILPLTVSSRQGGAFFQQMGTGSDGWTNLAMAVGIIFSSPIIAWWVSRSFDNDRIGRGVIGVLACIGIMLFSNVSSSMAIMSSANLTIDKQLSSSPEVEAFQEMIASNNASKATKQDQIDGRGAVKWASKRDGWSAEIKKMNSENVYYLSQINKLKEAGHGSPMQKSFAKFEEFGITLFGISILAACLLDVIAFVAGLMLGAEFSRYQKHASIEKNREVTKPKKFKTQLKAAA